MKRIVIIGGGIVGATAAFELAKRKVDVTIIDSKEKGRATSAAAGIICPWVSQRRNKAWYELANKGAIFLEQLIDQLENHGKKQTGYKKVGALRLHTDITKLAKIEKLVNKRRESNDHIGDVKLFSNAETKEKFPFIADHYNALYVSGAARVDGRALRDTLIEAAVQLGANLIDGHAELFIEESEVVGVNVTKLDGFSTNEKIYAETIILTNGIWMPKTLSALNVHLQIAAQKGEIVHMHDEAHETDNFPVIMAPFDHYILSFSDGKIVAGATRENDPKHMRKTIGGLHTVIDHALEVAPKLSDSTYVETRVGMRPFTSNHLPIFGALPNVENVYLANGLGSSGLSTGPFIANQLTKMIFQEERDIDWKLYDVTQAIK